MRSTEQHSQNGDDGEERENDETDAVDDHGGELPVEHHLVLLLFPLDPRRDVAQLADNGLQVPLSLLKKTTGFQLIVCKFLGKIRDTRLSS